MKKFLLSLIALATFAISVNAQTVVDAEEGRNPNDFYQTGIVVGKRAIPYPFLRESDVVWKMAVWRQIDLNENFNQFLYYPIEQGKNEQGRINIVNLLKNAAENGEFDIYEDDDMKVPLEWSKALVNLQGRQLKVRYGEEDEFGEQESFNDTIAVDFDPAGARMLKLKEYWYIDKQDTRQKVRITGLAFHFTKEMLRSGVSEEVGDWSFWVPMDDMRVRQVLVNANAYDENNDVAERSYDDIFIQRYFDSYVVRESNVYNREISKYLTGEDAIYESQRIEDKIFDMENDMWEY